MKKIIFILTVILAVSASLYAGSYYIIDEYFIAPEEFDAKKAAPLKVEKISGKKMEKALKGVFEFEGNNLYLITKEGKENLEEGEIEYYYPKYGLAYGFGSSGYDMMYDVKNKKWLYDAEMYDPEYTKESPDKSRRITFTQEFDGMRQVYYEEKDNGSYKLKGSLNGIGKEYYWETSDIVKVMFYRQIYEGGNVACPVAGPILKIEKIRPELIRLEEGVYDKSRTSEPVVWEPEKAMEMLRDRIKIKNDFVVSLKTRSGKEFYIPPIFKLYEYYPQQDIVILELYVNSDGGLYSYSLATGEVYKGKPWQYVTSPDGKYRVNSETFFLEEKTEKGFQKTAQVSNIINPVYCSMYWGDDNKTLYYLKIEDKHDNKGMHRTLVPVSIKIIE